MARTGRASMFRISRRKFLGDLSALATSTAALSAAASAFFKPPYSPSAGLAYLGTRQRARDRRQFVLAMRPSLVVHRPAGHRRHLCITAGSVSIFDLQSFWRCPCGLQAGIHLF
jgi:hypothetical protein